MINKNNDSRFWHDAKYFSIALIFVAAAAFAIIQQGWLKTDYDGRRIERVNEDIAKVRNGEPVIQYTYVQITKEEFNKIGVPPDGFRVKLKYGEYWLRADLYDYFKKQYFDE